MARNRGRRDRRRPAAPGRRAPRRNNGRAPRTQRSKPSNVLAQGTGSAPGRAFGAAGNSTALSAWDAFSPSHLPLPRVTGPYCVVRCTTLITAKDAYMQFGTLQDSNQNWTNACAVSCKFDGIGNTLHGTNNAYRHVTTMPGLGSAVTAVPSALSVQVLNPEALQTTTGIIAGGTYKTQVNLQTMALDDTSGTSPDETWEDVANNFISFQAPRLLSAGKLALKGVQINSYPLNMSEIANFTPINDQTNSLISLGSGGSGVDSQFVGFAPICFVNKSQVELNYLCTTEWRVRFSIDNPAVAAHRYHGYSDDAKYAAFMHHRTNMGHGCYDIADASARSGVPRGTQLAITQ